MTTFVPGWDAIPEPLRAFWTERHLCTLTTLRPDGRPHVVPVGAAIDPERACAWVITNATSRKALNLLDTALLAVCQVDGGRWSTIEGTGTVLTDEKSVRRAEERYASRYRTPKPNPLRVAVRIEIERFLVSAAFAPPTTG